MADPCHELDCHSQIAGLKHGTLVIKNFNQQLVFFFGIFRYTFLAGDLWQTIIVQFFG